MIIDLFNATITYKQKLCVHYKKSYAYIIIVYKNSLCNYFA